LSADRRAQEEEERVKAEKKRRRRLSFGTAAASATTLAKVVDFLRGLDVFPEVVVGCARKIDPASWDLLFTHVGDPDQFFHHCIEARRTP
jgi:hypothetical protein